MTSMTPKTIVSTSPRHSAAHLRTNGRDTPSGVMGVTLKQLSKRRKAVAYLLGRYRPVAPPSVTQSLADVCERLSYLPMVRRPNPPL